MLQMQRGLLYGISTDNYVNSPNIIRITKSNKFLESRKTSPRGGNDKRIQNFDQSVWKEKT